MKSQKTLWVIMGIAALSITTGLAFSKYHWGYWLYRPGPSAMALEATRVGTVMALDNWRTPGADGRLARSSESSARSVADLAGKYPYDMPEGRVLLAWQQAGLSLKEGDFSDQELTSIVKLIDGEMPAGSPGYENWAKTRSVILAKFEGPSRQGLVLAAARGGQIANDHYPYVELVIDQATGAVLDKRSFYFDIAGVEGLEWYYAATICAVLMVFATGGVMTAAAAVRFIWRSGRRLAVG